VSLASGPYSAFSHTTGLANDLYRPGLEIVDSAHFLMSLARAHIQLSLTGEWVGPNQQKKSGRRREGRGRKGAVFGQIFQRRRRILGGGRGGPPEIAISPSSALGEPEIRPPPAGSGAMQTAASWSKSLRGHLCAAASFHSTPVSPAKWKSKWDCKV
jgi:hypothetical protein